MKQLKELDVDFIKSTPMTKKEERELSEFLATLKIKSSRKNKKNSK